MGWLWDIFYSFLAVGGVAGLFYVGLHRGWIKVDNLLQPDEKKQLALLRQKVAELEAARKVSWNEHRAERDSLSSVIARLENENRQLKLRVEELEKHTHIAIKPLPEVLLPTKPLLLILGSDPNLWDTDRLAIGRAGILFQRITYATKASIEAELQARRQDRTLYPWIHITSHADASGIHLSDGVAEAMWWYDTFRGTGIKVVFLAACKTNHVASALAGLVTVVFVNNEDIENADAGAFTYAFWRMMKEHGDARRAYDEAIVEVPQVSEFTDIRTG